MDPLSLVHARSFSFLVALSLSYPRSQIIFFLVSPACVFPVVFPVGARKCLLQASVFIGCFSGAMAYYGMQLSKVMIEP